MARQVPALDQLIKPVERTLAVSLGRTQQRQLLPPPLVRLVAFLEKRYQQLGQALGRQYALFERVQDNPIELLHPNGTTGAGGLAARGSPRAGVIAVLTRLPVRMVMAPPQFRQPQRAIPVRSVGPETTLAGVCLGLRCPSRAWTVWNISSSMMGGTAIGTHSSRLRRSPVRESF